MKMLPTFYQAHLESQLDAAQYLSVSIGSPSTIYQKKSIEGLANAFPLPIQFESRRRKIQRLLSLNELKIETIWFLYSVSG